MWKESPLRLWGVPGFLPLVLRACMCVRVCLEPQGYYPRPAGIREEEEATSVAEMNTTFDKTNAYCYHSFFLTQRRVMHSGRFLKTSLQMEEHHGHLCHSECVRVMVLAFACVGACLC